MSALRYLAEYSGRTFALATISDTSLSTASPAGGRAARRTVANTSVSTASIAGRLTDRRTVLDTSLSIDGTPLAIRANVVDQSVSTETVGGGLGVARTILNASLSTETAPFGAAAVSTSDISLSSTATPIASQSAHRTISNASPSSDSVHVAARIISTNIADTSLSRASLAVIRYRVVSDTSLSTATATTYVQFEGYEIHIRERAPLRLSVNVFAPDGTRVARWAADDSKVENIPGNLNFSTVAPGGHEQGSAVLARDPSYSYPDLVELSKIQVVGAGNQIASEGRLESLPASGGDQASVTPSWNGYQSHLADDNSAREIFVDRALNSWQGPSVQRQLQWLQNSSIQANGPSVSPDYTTGYPALTATLSGSWTEGQIVEAWYDARGIPIGRLYCAWKTNDQFALTGGMAFGAGIFLTSEDTGVNYDQVNPILSTPGMATLLATTNRPWAILQFWNVTVPGGKDGVDFTLYFTATGVYGRHGLPLYGTDDYQGAQGVLASDVMAYSINRWCPLISYTTGPNGSIQPSSFVLDNLVFLDPTTVAAMQAEAVKFELLDWFVWDGPTYYLGARNSGGKKWRTRMGACALQEAGPQITRLWNGVMATFTDETGVTRSVGPPGSGANQEDESLLDRDPDNPSNHVFDPNGQVLRRWAPLSVGTSSFAGAIAVGQRFLQEQRLLDSSGQATITGHVQDMNGIWWPAWMMRAGDQLAIVDSNDPSYRRLVHTAYDDPSKAAALQLGAPPDGLQALLERLQASLTPWGI